MAMPRTANGQGHVQLTVKPIHAKGVTQKEPLFRPLNNKPILHLRHSHLGIIVHCRRRRQQKQHRLVTDLLLRQTDELSADPLMLILLAYCQVAQITAITKIGERTRDTHQYVLVPGRYDKIGMRIHPGDAIFIRRPPQSGIGIQFHHRIRCGDNIELIVDWVHKRDLLCSKITTYNGLRIGFASPFPKNGRTL